MYANAALKFKLDVQVLLVIVIWWLSLSIVMLLQYSSSSICQCKLFNWNFLFLFERLPLFDRTYCGDIYMNSVKSNVDAQVIFLYPEPRHSTSYRWFLLDPLLFTWLIEQVPQNRYLPQPKTPQLFQLQLVWPRWFPINYSNTHLLS